MDWTGLQFATNTRREEIPWRINTIHLNSATINHPIMQPNLFHSNKPNYFFNRTVKQRICQINLLADDMSDGQSSIQVRSGNKPTFKSCLKF